MSRAWVLPPLLERCAGDRDGGVAVPFALAVLVLAALAFGAVDMTSLQSQRSRMRDAADEAALAAAMELSVAETNGAGERGASLALDRLAPLAGKMTFSAQGSVAQDRSSVTIRVTGHRPAYFALLAPNGWDVEVASTAKPVALAPLCVLNISTSKSSKLSMADNAQLTAPGCLVQSNSDLSAGGSSQLTAAVAQAAGAAGGNIRPKAQTGAPAIDDPFASLSLRPNLPVCNPLDIVYAAGIQTLAPGVHCGKIKIDKGTTLQLLPGEHYFQGKLELKKTGVLRGSNVVLIFDKASDFSFQDDSVIDLSGRQSGIYTGFLIATTRANTGVFEISTTSARKLLGTIYVPNAKLVISGTSSKVADQSDWTVVVAKEISMTGAPNLVINTDYKGSPVPVPKDIPSTHAPRLVK